MALFPYNFYSGNDGFRFPVKGMQIKELFFNQVKVDKMISRRRVFTYERKPSGGCKLGLSSGNYTGNFHSGD